MTDIYFEELPDEVLDLLNSCFHDFLKIDLKKDPSAGLFMSNIDYPDILDFIKGHGLGEVDFEGGVLSLDDEEYSAYRMRYEL